VQVAGDDRLRGTHDLAGGREADVDPMGAEVALRGGSFAWVDVDGVVRARLHARLAADARVRVEVDDAVGSAVEGKCGADCGAGRIVAVIAAQDCEVPARVREGALLDVLYPGAEDAERHLVLGLARDGARVASDALRLVEDEAVAHRAIVWISVEGSVNT
jgi:hypothetical protein